MCAPFQDWAMGNSLTPMLYDNVLSCRTVCVNPASLDIAAELCAGTDTKICVVCDFPFGLSTTRSKCLQAEEYCRRGDIFELDVVANYGWIRSGMWDEVGADIRAVAEVCHKYGTALKVILETDALDAQQIAEATRVAVSAPALPPLLIWSLYQVRRAWTCSLCPCGLCPCR